MSGTAQQQAAAADVEEAAHAVVHLRATPRPEDTAQLRALYNAAFPIQYGDSFYDALSCGTYNGKPLLSVVAEVNGVIIGAVSASFDGSGVQVVDAPKEAVYILTLAVAPAWRRQGVAAMLMESVDKWSKALPSVDAIFLHVVTSNAPAIAFYERLGFTKFKREYGFYLIHDSLEDAFLYVRYVPGVSAKTAARESFIERLWGMLYRAVVKLVLFTSGSDDDAAAAAAADQVEKAPEDALV